MEARAIKRYIRSSPRKMRLVIDLIRGKKADEALSILKFTPNHASEDAMLVLKSAIGNLNNKVSDGGQSYTNKEIIVKTAMVDQGPTVKRILPAPMGRAYRVRKRSNHLTIVVVAADKTN